AGQYPAKTLEAGAASKVMPGAPVPEGTGQVIMVEDTDAGNEVVRVSRHDGRTNLCMKGEDVRAGQTILKAGVKLGPLHLANLISCGVAEVSVRKPVRVTIFATGDEIVDSPDALTPGKIMNSNGPMLEALARENGLDVVTSAGVADELDALTDALRAAVETADLILLSGGVSAGDFDFVPAAMKEAGFTIHFDSVSVQPGRPVTFATHGNRIALGMPGNPVSVFLCFHLYARRIAALLSGGVPPVRAFQVAVEAPFRRKHGGRMGFYPCQINAAGRAESVAYHGSAHLLALCEADGFIQVPQGVTEIPAGGTVRFYPLHLGKW
ncbi:MAG: molybdopterin molybdotransferase, partial [Candidatus Hydrogenedentes bacterium]|nr:molybdopterin molybdotransferase [Candidatus Hydrogenedentota bacterium]